MEMPSPENTLPMMTGTGPYGPLEMGGMFSVLKVRKDQKPGDYSDPGWYTQPAGTQAYEWSGPEPAAASAPASATPDSGQPAVELKAVKPDGHSGHH
jgi:hypothetical protein